MQHNGYFREPIVVVGNEQPVFSLVVCLLQAGHPVTLCTQETSRALEKITTHWEDVYGFQADAPTHPDIVCIPQLKTPRNEKLVIAMTRENISEKKAVLRQLEEHVPTDAIIAINTESIPLHELQQHAMHQERIIGANWVEPVHTTFFLEIIINEHTSKKRVDRFYGLAKDHWQKDPYVLRHGSGIRTRMLCAMIREAFYLVKEGYVTPEDIDRACRNDPGYYFPFAGNFRYMDLMGAYIYGVVMQDLNPDLSKDRTIPDFFHEILAKGHHGMESGQGFYAYEEGEVEQWQAILRKFSYQIQEIIAKYPFNYQEEEIPVKN